MSREEYSPVYQRYRLHRVFGLRERRPIAVTDTFWPMVLGETGVIGFLGAIGFFALLLRDLWRAAGPRGSPETMAFTLGALMVLVEALTPLGGGTRLPRAAHRVLGLRCRRPGACRFAPSHREDAEPFDGLARRQLHHARRRRSRRRHANALEHRAADRVVDRHEHHRLAVLREARQLERRDVDAGLGEDRADGADDPRADRDGG